MSTLSAPLLTFYSCTCCIISAVPLNTSPLLPAPDLHFRRRRVSRLAFDVEDEKLKFDSLDISGEIRPTKRVRLADEEWLISWREMID